MYFITEQDPNYSIKGSRDPLGFQVVWQAAGRKLIPYLSTVSGSIKDFQILCLAYALKKELKIEDKQFEPFFLRFEQMMAYTRYKSYQKEGFNGVDKVRKLMSGNPASVRISSAIADQLLSNQKAYGIWGKYNSPFSEMRLTEMPEYSNVYIPKVLNNDAFLRQATLLSKKRDAQPAYIESDKMDEWSDFLQKPSGIEKKLFIEKLLDDTCGKELLNQIDNNPDFRDLSFYELIQALTDASSNSNFKAILGYIANTEKVICPLNRIFRYLQTKSYWKNEEIETDPYIKNWRSTFESKGFDETTRSLATLLTLSNYELVLGLVKRNEEVAARRNSAAWMQFTEKGLEVNHFEGAFFREEYDPETQNDFNYFFPLLSLYTNSSIKMERIILRDHIKEAIKNRKVIAAVFHTFNFDPLFFENFVMPLFVPGKDFRDEAIYNKILWRYCAKENLIPPVAVFCDYYAKDNTQAPTLGYDIYCLKVPSAIGAICNFHPKHIFILVEDENRNRTLLFITGSGNLTPTGWCDNFECFSVLELKPTKNHPNRSSTNGLQDYISEIGKIVGLQNLLPAEEIIHEFLRYVDFDLAYYNSLTSPFIEFLEQQSIFSGDNISEVEIISPYFSNDTKLIEQLQSKGVKRIKCLIPTLRTNEILLDKESFIAFQNAGLEWCYWSDNKANTEVRNQHSKIYRFYSNRDCYTFIGSVNFTQPAWVGFSKRNNKGNIESGILYVEQPGTPKLLKKAVNLNIETLLFLEKDDLENAETTTRFDRNAPNIEFTIDWKSKALRINAKVDKFKCSFYKSFDDAAIVNGKSEIILLDYHTRQLAKNTLIKVLVKHGETESIYSYYPIQINIETKPLGFKLDANTVLKYWQFFNDEIERQKLTKGFAENTTDESGIIDEKRIETKLLLNEMAAHFSGLSKLEKYLFNEKLNSQERIKAHFTNLQYYLVSENIDTIPFYLNDLKQQKEQGTIQNSFYWMVIQIINQIIYSKAEKWEHSWVLDKATWKQFKTDIKERKTLLSNEADIIENEIPGLNQRASWVLEQLVTEYD